MFCRICGVALSDEPKYCSRCGAKFITKEEASVIKLFEKQLRGEMIEAFWVTVIGLGFILGGLALMRRVLHLSEGLIIAYMIVSSTAFMTNFGLGVWNILRLASNSKQLKGTGRVRELDGSESGRIEFAVTSTDPVTVVAAPSTEPTLEPAASVTEKTTHKLEPGSKERDDACSY